MTPLQEALASPASKKAKGTEPAASKDVFEAPTSLFDRDAILTELSEAVAGVSDRGAMRSAAVPILRRAHAEAREVLANALTAHPFEARAAVEAYSAITDALMQTVYEFVTVHVHPNPNPSTGEVLSLLAVGGYGRAEMAPHSDIDLLFLSPMKTTAWAESTIESMLYIMWDLHLKVGYSSRTVRECIRLGKEDHTIRTAMLEHRWIYGDKALADELTTRLTKELFANSVPEFIEAKLTERSERHRKQGGQRYMVEPNVKEGKGGLRDLQNLYWIAKYSTGKTAARELVKAGLFRQGEYDKFRSAEDFLLAVRCQLHLIADRAMDQLTFDMQVQVADRLGYTDKSGRRAVEHFMQDYFRHATAVGELTRIFLTGLEARHVKKAPSLVGMFKRRKKLIDGYKIEQNRITFANEKKFLKDRLNLLRIFEEALRTGYLIHPDAMRVIAANLDMIDDEMRADPDANRIFLGLLLNHGNPERGLRRMNELGVLAAFMPEFAPVVAMMQFNMYHAYTVDEHTIQCISTLAQIEREELVEELPIASRILKDGVNRKVLYTALLLHDIGKGRPDDHSILGAQIARTVAPRLGFKKEDAETIEWLVRHHLRMSDAAQKRDISDPRTVRDFAKLVASKKRLDLLTVLTVCDIRGVGPNTWNNWKAELIRTLYRQTAGALENGLEDLNRGARENEAKRALRASLSDWDTKDLRRETGRHYGPYWQGLPADAHRVFAELLRDITDDEISIDLFPDHDRDATRASFAMQDHPGIFARLAGALAIVGANVVDARTYTTKDGYVTAVFWIQDRDRSPFEESRLPRLRATIKRTLLGEVIARDALQDRDKIKKRERDFKVPTTITFDNEASDIYTLIEVDTRDRPALLYDLTRTLANSNVYIASAVIATYGEQAVDTFYVKDMFGLKFRSVGKQKTLEKRLREAIDKGAERAHD